MLTGRIAKQLVAPATPLFAGGSPLDLVDLASVKLEMGISVTTDDVWLAKAITRASIAAENYCNRTFVPALWQDQVWPGRDAYPWQLPPRLAPLQLDRFPILGGPSLAGTAPPQAPVLSALPGGALTAATYYARLSYVTETGETALSQETALSLAASNLLSVAAPGPDPFSLAIGYNVYVGATPFGETRQNASPIGVNSAWVLADGGVTVGAAMPKYVTLVENAPISPTPLAEGVDFLVGYGLGQVTRLFSIDGQPKAFSLPITAIYGAGFSTIPDDLQDAVILMVKGRYYARTRDPMIRSQNVTGVYEAAYFFATGPGGQGDLPVDVMAKLDRYRVPVTA